MPSAVSNPSSTFHSHLPSKQTAIVQHENGELKVTRDVPLPKVGADMVLVKVHAVALNPCDYKMASRFPSPGAIDGCDFSGTVVAQGPVAEKIRSFQVGDRVCGAVHGSNPIDHQSGSFAEYVAIDAEFLFKIPDSLSFDDAAAIGGTVVGTLGLVFFDSLALSGSLAKPAEKPAVVLVYGGSTSVGTMSIQLLKLLGHRPITTCSPKNFGLVKSYGAEAVFDYNSPTCAEEIKKYTKNGLAYVLDIITDVKSMRLCYACIGRAGGKYTCLEEYPEDLHTRKTVKPELVMGISILGRRIALDYPYGSEASPERRKLGVKWYVDFQTALNSGKIRSHPVKIFPGGFDGMLEGLEVLKNKQVSGEKLVVRIQ